MSELAMTPVGERAARFVLPEHTPRAALLDWLLAQPGVVDASLAAEHALVVFRERPTPLVLPALDADAHARRDHTIAVAYDGDDLDAVAALTGLSRSEVVARHVAHPLEVSFVGFCPGFAYLVGLDPALASVPRMASPRARVPAHSVAIAGGYGGIYPAPTPGGWHLLGRAIDARLLDGERPRLAVGDRVRFVPA